MSKAIEPPEREQATSGAGGGQIRLTFVEPMPVIDHPKTEEEMIERGRVLVEAGDRKPASMVDAKCVIAYEKSIFASRGQIAAWLSRWAQWVDDGCPLIYATMQQGDDE